MARKAASRKRVGGRTVVSGRAAVRYDRSVFINCPFDARYAALFDATVFAIAACGFTPRSALEIDDASRAIAAVRAFLSTAAGTLLPGGKTLVRRFTEFRAELPAICARFGLEPDELTFPDYCLIVTDWLAAARSP